MTNTASESGPTARKSTTRFVSLDAFRGLTIAGMILVNTPGSWSYVFPPLRHAQWHGATPTDLVFPFFLFIVGTAMWFSFGKYDRKLDGGSSLKILRRTILIFGIGFLLSAFPFRTAPGELRILGVLQRIALAYGIASVLCLLIKDRYLPFVGGAILLGYWALLELGGGPHPYALETNLPRRIDLAVLGASHLYEGFGIPFDPEGLLSTLPAVATVIIGYLSGRVIGDGRELSQPVVTLFLSGTLLFLVGLAWDAAMPINKPLWTSSYVAYTGGIAQIMLAWLIWLIDIRGFRRWAHPFKIYGMNPLFAYVLSIFWVKVLIYLVRLPADGGTLNGYAWLFSQVFEPLAGPMFGSLLFALTHVLVIWVVVWFMYKKGIFVKI